MTVHTTKTPIHPKNIVKLGSARHMTLLGLRKVTAKEKERTIFLQHGGYTLADRTAFGFRAKEEHLLSVLLGKVAALDGKPPKLQSDDPTKPHYAPKQFIPKAAKVGMPTADEIASAMAILERAKGALN